MSTGLIRPVRCFFCNQDMYYCDDERHTPEVHIMIDAEGPNSDSEFYAHVICWNKVIEAQKHENTNSLASETARERP